MPADATAAGTSAWTLMLADIVALMLAFFVLTFSMREMVDADRRPAGGEPVTPPALVGEAVATGGAAADPGLGVPLALAPNEGHAADQLQAPERATAEAPSLAYLAAIIQADAWEPSPGQVWHDDTRLVVELPPELPDSGGPPLAGALARPLLTLAFLARRFDLELAVALPADHDDTLVTATDRALRLRDRLADATGLPTLEVTVAAVGPGMVPATPRSGSWAAVQVKPAGGSALGSTP